jgi:DNA-binding NarL/FixJ family response regulator
MMSMSHNHTPIKIILITPHPLIYQAVARQIEDCADLTLAAWGKTAAEVMPLVEEHSPQVVLLDFDLPPGGADGCHQGAASSRNRSRRTGLSLSDDLRDRAHVWSLIEQLRGEHPGVRLALLAAHPDARLPGGLTRWGLHGALLKDDPLTLCLPEVVRTIGSGGCCVSQAILDIPTLPAEAVSPPPLTPRQVEILATIVAQPRATYDDCARDLGISRHTFDTHLRGIYNALGVSSLVAAVIISAQWGIIAIPDAL